MAVGVPEAVCELVLVAVAVGVREAVPVTVVVPVAVATMVTVGEALSPGALASGEVKASVRELVLESVLGASAVPESEPGPASVFDSATSSPPSLTSGAVSMPAEVSAAPSASTSEPSSTVQPASASISASTVRSVSASESQTVSKPVSAFPSSASPASIHVSASVAASDMLRASLLASECGDDRPPSPRKLSEVEFCENSRHAGAATMSSANRLLVEQISLHDTISAHSSPAARLWARVGNLIIAEGPQCGTVHCQHIQAGTRRDVCVDQRFRPTGVVVIVA